MSEPAGPTNPEEEVSLCERVLEAIDEWVDPPAELETHNIAHFITPNYQLSLYRYDENEVERVVQLAEYFEGSNFPPITPVPYYGVVAVERMPWGGEGGSMVHNMTILHFYPGALAVVSCLNTVDVDEETGELLKRVQMNGELETHDPNDPAFTEIYEAVLSINEDQRVVEGERTRVDVERDRVAGTIVVATIEGLLRRLENEDPRRVLVTDNDVAVEVETHFAAEWGSGMVQRLVQKEGGEVGYELLMDVLGSNMDVERTHIQVIQNPLGGIEVFRFRQRVIDVYRCEMIELSNDTAILVLPETAREMQLDFLFQEVMGLGTMSYLAGDQIVALMADIELDECGPDIDTIASWHTS